MWLHIGWPSDNLSSGNQWRPCNRFRCLCNYQLPLRVRSISLLIVALNSASRNIVKEFRLPERSLYELASSAKKYHVIDSNGNTTRNSSIAIGPPF